MPLRIEDYAMIGDCETAALVGRDGSIDWLCLPRFDSPACFAALLGNPDNGRWLIAPTGEVKKTTRRYREGTLILETTFETADGSVTLIDCMPTRDHDGPALVRTVRGDRGNVRMKLHFVLRFDYGSLVPWVTRLAGGGAGTSTTGAVPGMRAVAGPDTVLLRTPVSMRGEHMSTVAEFTVVAGEEVTFALTWHPSHEPDPQPFNAREALQNADTWWRKWSANCRIQGPYREQVLRSLITLKALTYAPTGGIVAAPTTSLPEQLGGVRNWDYRFCWLRDATFTLMALMAGGYRDEARAWREWLLRAVAGSPDATQIMYGLAGERRLLEWEAKWLPGYQGAKPVRIGNAASEQFQLDVYGEVMDAMYQSRRTGLEPEQAAWDLEQALLGFLETAWDKPDDGIWEVRGPRRDFVQSKVMAWVAFDRAIKTVEKLGMEGPVDKWRKIRDTIHKEVCEKGFNRDMNSFVQYYGANHLDASLLMIPQVGFLPAYDPRVRGTVEAIEKHLMDEVGFVKRYPTESGIDGLPPGEGAFLPCTFWLADDYELLGRHEDAEDLFKRLLGLCNDVGLISEEYDAKTGRLVGNFPQAFTHVGLVNTALNLTHKENSPVQHRKES
jgi:GH15 family glucan-1,4-alpha-glucosidase